MNPRAFAIPLLAMVIGCSASLHAAPTPVTLSIPAVLVSTEPVASERAAVNVPAATDRARVARFVFEGNTVLTDALLHGVTRAEEVSTADEIQEQAERDVAAISTLYANQGYPFAHVDLVRALDHAPFMDLWIRIDEGSPFRIRKVSIVDDKTNRFLDVWASSATVDATHRSYTFEVVEGRPETPSALLEQARTRHLSGERAKARALLMKLARLFPGSSAAVRARLEIADIDFELGQFAYAEYEYSAWAALHPTAPEVLYASDRAKAAHEAAR